VRLRCRRGRACSDQQSDGEAQPLIDRLTKLVPADRGGYLLPKSTRLGLDRNVRGFFFVRGTGRHDFDERDRAVLTVLRSQLAAIRDRWRCGAARPA
jgi:hypothetical protein